MLKFPCSRALVLRVHVLADHERPTVFREESQLINPLPTFIFHSISQPLKLLVFLSACIMHWELTQSEVLGLAECPGLSSERQLCLEGRGQCSTAIDRSVSDNWAMFSCSFSLSIQHLHSGGV